MLDRHLFDSLYKQCHLEDVTAGSPDWHYSLEPGSQDYGKLKFGADLAYDFQILGSHSHLSDTWLWSWANREGGAPPDLTVLAEQLKAFDVPEFSQAQFPVGSINGHILAIVATALLDCDAYYRAPHDFGESFLLIKDETFKRRGAGGQPEDELVRLNRVICQGLTFGWLSNLWQAIHCFLGHRASGDRVISPDRWIYHFQGGGQLCIHWADGGQISSTEVRLENAAPAPGDQAVADRGG